ncbi:MAG TPA: hypothetical protein VJZ75_05850 [Candidatus Bathyarchaeia archaeon]|nr:hypothetical protein [Candidatus Bathyarchaeia archaeon]
MATMAKRYNIYRVTWKENEIEYVEKFVDESIISIQQIPERFKTVNPTLRSFV